MQSVSDTLIKGFGALNQGFQNKEKNRMNQLSMRSQALKEALSQADLKDRGYLVDEQPGGDYGVQFNLSRDPQFTAPEGFVQVGGKFVQDPNYFNEDLARRKASVMSPLQDEQLKQAEAETGLAKMKTDRMSQFNTGNQFSIGGQDSSQALIYDPIGDKMMKNPAYMNPLQEQKLTDLQSKEVEKKNKQKLAMSNLQESANSGLRTIEEIKSGINNFGLLGNMPSWTAALPGGVSYRDRANWEANVDKLKDSLVVDLMMKMKEASATGSTGFGQMSEKEGARLEHASTALRRSLDPRDAARYLKELEDSYNAVLDRINAESGGQPEQTGGGVPEWVPQNFDYAEAKKYYTDDELRQMIFKGNGQV